MVPEAMLPPVPIPQIIAFALGAAVVARTILSAVRAFMLPRASHDRVARFVFRSTRRVFNLFAGPSVPYETRDRYLAYFGPVSLVMLPVTWLFLIASGYAAMFWALGVGQPHWWCDPLAVAVGCSDGQAMGVPCSVWPQSVAAGVPFGLPARTMLAALMDRIIAHASATRTRSFIDGTPDPCGSSL